MRNTISLDCFTSFAMTRVLEFLSLRASVATRGNPVNKKMRHLATIFTLSLTKQQPSPSHWRATPLRGRGIKNAPSARFLLHCRGTILGLFCDLSELNIFQFFVFTIACGQFGIRATFNNLATFDNAYDIRIQNCR